MRRALILLTVALAACATSEQPIGVPGIQSATEQQVAACKYLDTVAGASGWYGVFARKGLENARLAALEQAQALGATHVVWQPLAQGHGSSQAAGRAFRCN